MRNFLERFYSDMRRWSLHVDLRFLAARAKPLFAQEFTHGVVVFDRCYVEGIVFTGLAAAQGLVDAEEHETYTMLFNILHTMLPKPAALIYLHAAPQTLLERVQRRGRPFEQHMPLDYLQDLQRHYDNWAAAYRDAPVLSLDTDAQDFREVETVNRVVEQLAPWLRAR